LQSSFLVKKKLGFALSRIFLLGHSKWLKKFMIWTHWKRPFFEILSFALMGLTTWIGLVNHFVDSQYGEIKEYLLVQDKPWKMSGFLEWKCVCVYTCICYWFPGDIVLCLYEE
jgi:hypothetical protein